MKQGNVYACYNRNEKVRFNSSSGAVFSLLADYVLNKDGIVYGVTMSEDCYSAEYIGVTCKEDIVKLRGSKYLQAKMGNTYCQVKENVLSGRKVLFSGTGCQVNGLKKFLGQDYDNLICVDVICHGAPSPELWKKYVQYQEDKNHGKLRAINFRCKNDSWQNFGMNEVLKENSPEALKQVYISKDVDSYMQMFLRDYCLRPSCYECIAKKEKKSDLTIADFWGIENIAPEMNDGKGTSLVLLRTEKGKKIFEMISGSMNVKEVNYGDGVHSNPAEYSSAKRPAERETFFENMQNMSFADLEKMYGLPVKISMKRKIKKKVKRMIKTHLLRCGGAKVMRITDYYLCFQFECERNLI